MALTSAPSVPVHGHSPHAAFGAPPHPGVLLCFVLFSRLLCVRGLGKLYPKRFSFVIKITLQQVLTE